ncbi:MAG: type II toxin-antitoxin system RelE/ParE family toxin [Olegusella sp.]|nr:type II toxin-antitoxin system RelE/ParE family toxin [Olegusella sp.]
MLEEYGPELGRTESKHIREGIFELRVRFSSDTIRMFYFFYSGQRIIVTNGFIKKTQKTPRGEIEKALRYKHDWEVRNETTHA